MDAAVILGLFRWSLLLGFMLYSNSVLLGMMASSTPFGLDTSRCADSEEILYYILGSEL